MSTYRVTERSAYDDESRVRRSVRPLQKDVVHRGCSAAICKCREHEIFAHDVGMASAMAAHPFQDILVHGTYRYASHVSLVKPGDERPDSVHHTLTAARTLGRWILRLRRAELPCVRRNGLAHLIIKHYSAHTGTRACVADGARTADGWPSKVWTLESQDLSVGSQPCGLPNPERNESRLLSPDNIRRSDAQFAGISSRAV